MSKKLFAILALLLVASLVLAACGTNADNNANDNNVVTADNDAGNDTGDDTGDNTGNDTGNDTGDDTGDDDTAVVVPETTRRGSWADTVVLIEEPSAEAAATRLSVGDIDVYAYTVADLGVLQTVEEDPNIVYSQSVGSYNELLFNPSGPLFNDGRFNPFADKRMREAMNMFVDRDYILQEILGGLGYIKFLPITGVFPDYARIADVAKAIEAQYAYNPDKAKEVMTEVLGELGAELVDGQWLYEGEQIELIMVIRTEDERRDYGDYISNLLDDFGFFVDRQYKTSAEASPIWLQSDPADGLWHMYTGGWISNQINRDQAINFQDFYTPLGWPGNLLWEAMNPSEEYSELAEKLANNQFTSMEERAAMLAEIAPMALQESNRIWLYDQTSFTPRRAEVEVTADLAAAVAGSRLWSYTLRRTGEEGGVFTVAMPSMLDNPWNPILGSNWVYDAAVIRAVSDWAIIYDPYTGLPLPQRLKSGDLYVQSGLPVGQTYDWVNLEFVDSIDVPADAWVDWDAASQTFITAEEKFPDGLTAKAKVVCNYEDELYQNSIWHDGSNFSIGDVVMRMIMRFDVGKEDSAIFDDGQVADVESFISSDFRGWRLASVDPLVVEFYTDNYQLDAENNFETSRNVCAWPEYDQGQAAWHTMTLGVMAEAAQQLAFSTAKSTELEVEWTNYIGGPSLEILSANLDQAIADNYIPYEPTLGQYVTAEEAAARYANLAQFYADYGHFWVGNGPMFVESIYPIEKTATLQNFPDFPDLASKWAGYAEPRLAEVEVDGPGLVPAGTEAVFDIFIDFKGEAYPLADIDNVKYLLFDATGAMVEVGAAEPVEDGLFSITLSGDSTDLESGASRIEVIVVPIVVSIPTLEAFEFVVE